MARQSWMVSGLPENYDGVERAARYGNWLAMNDPWFNRIFHMVRTAAKANDGGVRLASALVLAMSNADKVGGPYMPGVAPPWRSDGKEGD